MNVLDYRHHRVLKESGGVRDVYVASEELGREQDDMLRAINRTNLTDYMPYAHGGVKGRNSLTNALPHQHGEQFYKLDLWNAYRTVDKTYLRVMASVALTDLTDLIWPVPELVDNILERLVTRPQVDGLPTGFSTSPMFYNIYCLTLDNGLAAICEAEGLTYTRYLDDLTFSSPMGILSSRALRRKLRAEIHAMPGAAINDRKATIETMSKSVTVAGITLTRDAEYLYPSKKLLNGVDRFFDLIEEKISKGALISDHEEGQLHGYHSVLNLAGSAKESRSPYVQTLLARYNALVQQI